MGENEEIEITEEFRKYATQCCMDIGLTEDEAEREVDEYYEQY